MIYQQKQRADALGIYLTGADSDGGAQTDPDASLGNYRSSTEVNPLAALFSNCIPPVAISNITGANGEGTAYLRGGIDGKLYYTAPDGSIQGNGQTVLNGETCTLESDDDDKAIRVLRTSAQPVQGTMTLNILKAFNNVLGMSNVTNAQRVSGVDTYHGIYFYVHGVNAIQDLTVWINPLASADTVQSSTLGGAGTGTITGTDFSAWPETGFCRIEDSGNTLREIVYYSSRTSTVLTISSADHRELLGTSADACVATDLIYPVPGIRIAKETPAGNKSIQTIADENTAPTGLTWSTAITEATGVDIGNLAASNGYGLWVQRETPAGAIKTAELENAINFSFKAM